MPSHRILYSRKDVLVKNFIEADTEVPISNIVELAIEYYSYTGQYLALGSVAIEDEHKEQKGKTLYISEKSRADQFIKKSQTNGISFKKLMCRVIENGLEIQDNTKILSKKDYLIYMKEVKKLYENKPEKSVMENEPTKEELRPVKENMPDSVPQKQISDAESSEEPKYTGKAEETEKKSIRVGEKKKIDFADQFIVSFDNE